MLVPCVFFANGQVWSPDGEKIAFFYIHAIEDIYTVSPDGSDFQVLEGHPDRDFAPMWSPDGRRIAFTSVRDGHHEVYQFDTEGHHLQKLTETEFDSQDPSFSPDGEEFVFSSNRAGNNELFISDTRGNVRQISFTPFKEHTPRWSPDGESILFLYLNEDDEAFLHTMKIDGTNRRKLSNTSGFHPSFSRDGSRVCFVHVEDGAFEVHVISVEGGESTVLVSDQGYQAFYPQFSPDGTKVTFTRDIMEGTEEGLPALYSVDIGSSRCDNLKKQLLGWVFLPFSDSGLMAGGV